METKKLVKIMASRNYDLPIVTTRLDSQINGQTVGWLTQASMNPTVIAMGLSVERYTHALIKESKVFTVNYMPKDRQDLIELFGYKSGRDIDKFKDLSYSSAATGCPILDDAAAFLDCKLIDIYSINQYDLFFGEVVEADYKSLDWFQSHDFKSKKAA